MTPFTPWPEVKAAAAALIDADDRLAELMSDAPDTVADLRARQEHTRALVAMGELHEEDPDLAEAAVTADECRISRVLGLTPCPEDHALTLIRACPVCRAAL